MSLEKWQENLDFHFHRLMGERPAEIPIFGLEHGLNEDDLEHLKTEIREYAVRGSPFNAHQLPWIVYASELGYRYAGDEYWQTFEQSTPGWQSPKDRYWLRGCFHSFKERYRGAAPTGQWAEHFNIICWPITHAILPRDLQLQLARILYDLRDVLTSEILASPSLLGEEIRLRSWHASSRFLDFVQSPFLVGQIAAALLLEGDEHSHALILPSTLKRIVKDLGQTRQAREWLLDARNSAKRVQMLGLRTKSRQITSSPIAPGPRLRELAISLGIEPKILLRPKTTSQWEVVLDLPNLSPLMMRLPELSSVLRDSRCHVAGTVGAPLARGRLLYGTQRVVIQQWPRAGEVLLRFESSLRELDFILSTECLLRPGPIWLFKIQSDGFAYEICTGVLRPGHKYIVLNSEKQIPLSNLCTSISIACSGVHAVSLDLPPEVSPEHERFIKDLGLQLAKSLTVWPAGVPPASWDSEGHLEWLVADRYFLGIRADHAADSISLILDGDSNNEITMSPIQPGKCVFVQLPSLSKELHKVEFSLWSCSPEYKEESGELDIVIREPRAWIFEVRDRGALQLIVDPPSPTLDQLLDGSLALEINGPPGRRLACRISLFTRRDEKPFISRPVGKLLLPIEQASWKRKFGELLSKDPKVQEAFDSADTCRIDFDAEDLGQLSLLLERTYTPVRWIVKQAKQHYALRLIDDTDKNLPIEVCRHDFDSPEIPIRLDVMVFRQDFKVPPVGGLFVATAADCRTGIVIPPTVHTQEDLRALSVSPYFFGSYSKSMDEVNRWLALFELWSSARLAGNMFAVLRKRSLLLALSRHISGLVCGGGWLEAEREFCGHAGTESLGRLACAVSSKTQDQGFVVALERDISTWATASIIQRVSRLSDLAQRYLQYRMRDAVLYTREGLSDGASVPKGSVDLNRVTEFALRLASCPNTVRSWAGGSHDNYMRVLMNLPILARAARFVVLAVDGELRRGLDSDWDLYEGWAW
jgi:hypothetical protein